MKYARLLVFMLFLGACAPLMTHKEPNYALLEDNITAKTSTEDVNDMTQQTSNLEYAEQFVQAIRNLSSQLINNISGEGDIQGPIAVTTFVDLNYLYRTSPLGRYLAEALIGELQRAGLMVTEIRKTQSILIKERFGEYSLSRNVREISKHSNARFLLVGTYVVRGQYIFVNVRLVSNKDNLIFSSAKCILKRNPFLERMLWPTASPVTDLPVTIPIKGFGEKTSVEIIPAGS